MKKNNSIGAMEWFAWFWISAFLILAISTNGIFQGISLHSSAATLTYERPLLYCLIITSVCAVWIGTYFFHKKVELERRMLYALASIALCLVYTVSSLNSYSAILSKYGFWASLMVTLFFIAGTLLAEYERLIQVLPRVYLIFGYIVVFYGFLNLFGNTYLLDSLAYYEGVRITSIFQYANAYAILLLTLWIAIVIEINHSKKKWMRLWHGFMLVPVCVSFLLTLSRGAIVVLPIIAIVMLLMFRFKHQLMAIIYSIIAIGLSLVIYNNLERSGTRVYEKIQQAITSQTSFETKSIFSASSIGSWGLLVAASIVMAVIVYLVTKHLEGPISKWSEGLKTRFTDKMVPISILILVILGVLILTNRSVIQILPDVIANRLSNISLQTHSVYERLTMYKDAISIWKESPLIGNGGGAWEALYEEHQSYSYLSAQTHGYLAQLLVEVGLLGTIVYLGLIGAIIFFYIRGYRRSDEENRNKYIFYFIVPITILLHSLIDFGMSYMFYSLMVFLCLGVLAGTQRQKVNWALNKSWYKGIRWGVPILVSAVALIIVILSGRQISGLNKHIEVQNDIVNNVIFNRIEYKIDQSLSMSPKHPIMLLQASIINLQVYQQTEDKKYLDRAIDYIEKLNKYEPRYREAVEWNHSIAQAQEDHDKAIDIALDAVNHYPFDQPLYDLAASDLLKKWEALINSDPANSEQVAIQINDLYQKMKRHQEMNDALPDTINLLRTFAVSENVKDAVDKIQ
ncbi:O-antigen ligase family protein [Cohnella hongkongensis]|uniref:O-antigen ligase family protein n=1 Tax=Cohnella hongkongensis TaxID=178337 RepID=A0ABV9FEX6_9BACL